MKIISRSIYQAFGMVVPASVALMSQVQAVFPPPDGGYPNFITAEGTKAFANLTTGTANTAIGWLSLNRVTIGSFNSGVGAGAWRSTPRAAVPELALERCCSTTPVMITQRSGPVRF